MDVASQRQAGADGGPSLDRVEQGVAIEQRTDRPGQARGRSRGSRSTGRACPTSTSQPWCVAVRNFGDDALGRSREPGLRRGRARRRRRESGSGPRAGGSARGRRATSNSRTMPPPSRNGRTSARSTTEVAAARRRGRRSRRMRPRRPDRTISAPLARLAALHREAERRASGFSPSRTTRIEILEPEEQCGRSAGGPRTRSGAADRMTRLAAANDEALELKALRARQAGHRRS